MSITTQESCGFGVEVADQVFQAISVDILSLLVAESQTILIACGTESEGVLIYLIGSIEVFSGKNRNGYLSLALGIDAAAEAAGLDVDRHSALRTFEINVEVPVTS